MRTILIIVAFLFCLGLRAQAPVNFEVKFGGDGIDIGYGVKETFNRQYITIGSTTSYGKGASDAYLVLVDSMGQCVWQKTFGGFSSDLGKSVVVNPIDSGFVFAGFTSSFGSGGYDIYVVRTDKNGNLIWQSSFGGLDWDFGNDLIFSSDGNIIVCGSTFSAGYGKKDGILLKINVSNGNLIWQKNYGGQEEDEFQSLRITSDGYYGIAGNTKSYGDLNNDFWFFKTNASGDSITSSHLGSPNKAEMCYDFIEDNYHKLVFCGSYDTSFYNSGKNISYVIRSNLNGIFIDEFKDAGAFTSDDKFSAIANISFGEQYFLSRKVKHGSFGIDVQPYKLDYSLIFIYATTHGSDGEDEAFDVITTKGSGYLMIGSTNGFDLVSEDVLLIKLDSTMLSAALLVGIKENNSHFEIKSYYFENTIYMNNQSSKLFNYQLINSIGKIVQWGSTKESFIKINPELEKGIYVIRIIESDIKIKFIKE